MRKAIVMMLLAGVSSSAAAEWVGISDNEIATVYVDPATIRRVGDRIKMWDLIDFKVTQGIEKGQPYKSIKGQKEYDCKEEQWRVRYSSFHSTSMGEGGQVVISTDTSKWVPVVPGSRVEATWKFACGNR